MKNRIFSVLIMLFMLLAAIPTVSAADFSDIEEHWAREYIARAVDEGLFYGITEEEFSPNGTMTRAMFVTVLGRFEGIDAEYWSTEERPQFFKQDMDNDAYYAPYVRWAVCNGIVSGMNDFLFAPDAPITREQMARIFDCYLNELGYGLVEIEGVAEEFTDADSIAPWAKDCVEVMRECGLLSGYPNEDGTYYFNPQGTATRAEAATVFCSLMDRLVAPELSPVLPESISLEQSEIALNIGGTALLHVNTLPEDCDVLWRSSDNSIVSVDQTGLVSYVGEGITTVNVYTRNGLYATCEVTCAPDVVLPSADWTTAEKSEYLFGEVVNDPRLYYNSKDEAEADMVEVTVRTWDLKKNGEKFTREWELKVHKNLADAVVAIFEEIYHGEEQFPIHELYCYTWSGKSEHSIGTAIDINWSENYYCDPNGNALVGNYWKPGEDPYSIPKGGDVANAFEKYGFRWGINWNSGYKDYMHFSFFGT